MKRFEEVRNAAVVFVNHKEFKNHVELYDNETGFSFINNDDVVICGYDGDSSGKMTNVKIKFIKGEKPIVEFGKVTTTSHYIVNTIKDYIHYNS